MSTYTISRNGEQYGPYSEVDLIAHINGGQILSSDLAWKDGMAAWLPVSQIFPSGIQRAPAVPPPLFHTPGSSVTPASVPTPPGLHWALVLLFTLLTFGIFSWVWLFIQQNWIRRIAPETKVTGVVYLIGCIVCSVGANVASATDHPVFSFVLLVTGLGIFITWAIGSGNAMRRYYNEVEPIGLRLSTPMLVIFNWLYLQHHMHRIAIWKKTGRLEMQ